MKKLLAIILAVSMVLSLAGCGQQENSSSQATNGTKDIIWATASLGGTIQMVATAIATVVNKYETDLKITIQATGDYEAAAELEKTYASISKDFRTDLMNIHLAGIPADIRFVFEK